MRLTARIVSIAAISLLSWPASAQQTQPRDPRSSEIVVTGTRDEQVRDFVRILTPPNTRSIPRLIDEFCPVAVGLLPQQNQAVSARLRQVAAAVKVKVAAPDCVPNALVVVTKDKGKFIRALARRRPETINLPPHTIRRLASSAGPAAAWHMIGPTDSSGIPLRYDEVLGAYINDTSEAGSRIHSSGYLGFDASVVVVEGGALAGLTATQLADYAAMRLLAKVHPDRLPAPSPPTILTVLEAPMGSEIPITLTKWDLGLLRGLYSGSSRTLIAGAQRSQIVRQIKEDLEQPDP